MEVYGERHSEGFKYKCDACVNLSVSDEINFRLCSFLCKQVVAGVPALISGIFGTEMLCK